MKFIRRSWITPPSPAVAVMLSLFALGCLVHPGAASAASWISLGGSEGSPVAVNVLESTADRVVIDYAIPGFYAEPVTIDGRTYYAVTLAGESNLCEKGMPELPHICRSVIISDMEKMDVRVLEVQTEDLRDLPVAPSKGTILRTVDPATVPYVFGDFYSGGDSYPKTMASGGSPYILRDYRGMVIEVTPFLSQGQSGDLTVARHIVVEAITNGPDAVNVIDRPGPPASVVEEFANLYQHHFLNFHMDRYVPTVERGRMLVITYDGYHDAMIPFVEWKNQMGIPTQLVNVSAIGNTTAAIDATITSLFNTEGLAFVLLVGEVPQVTSFHWLGGASDPTYSTILGSDNYPELFIGRFSAETVAQVQTQVTRSVTYEKTPMAGATWYHKGTGIGSDQGPGDDGEYDKVHIENIRTKLLNYTYTEVDQIYDPGATAAMVTAALNNGRSIINYCGHGSETSWGTTGFSNTNVNALQNEWMLPFIISVACVNGQLENTTCFAEAWLRATRNGNPTGAIATYMASINQSWNPPMIAEDEVDDLLVNDEMRTFGGLCFNGSCQMMDEAGSGGVDMFLTWLIFGDPSLMVRTDTPVAVDVFHDGMLFPGQADYSVSVPGVTGALAALYANGVLYGSAYTDGTGTALIHMAAPPMEPMTLTLTVTAYNKIPVITPVEVLPPSGPYLVFDSIGILDAGGDNDGACDAGEAVGLELELKNIGVQTATGVTAAVSTADPNVQVTVGQAGFGDIPSGQVVSCIEPYQIEVDANAPDQHIVPFSVQVQSNEGQWDCEFNVLIMAPVLGAGATAIDDSAPGGNGNGGADPGETFFLQLWMANTGHASARNLVGNLTSVSQFVNVVDAAGECLHAPAGGNGLVGSFQVEVLPNCPNPATIPFHVALQGPGGYVAALDYNLSVGSWVDDVETDRGWTLGVPSDNATSGLWVRADPVGTVYNGQTIQTEDDHTANLATICFVTGNGTVGGAAGDADVDNGKTTLLSPVFPLGDAISATIEYWRWYTNNLGNNGGQDYWDVDVTSDGVNWVHLEHTTASANSWTRYTFQLENFVPLTNQVRVRFVADDTAPGSLVEAAVDDLSLTVVRSPATDVPAGELRLGNGILAIGPNPLGGEGRISYRVSRATHASIGLYDLSGRLIRQLQEGDVAAGEYSISVDGAALPSGIYFLRLDTNEIVQVRQVAIVR